MATFASATPRVSAKPRGDGKDALRRLNLLDQVGFMMLICRVLWDSSPTVLGDGSRIWTASISAAGKAKAWQKERLNDSSI